MLIPWQPGGLSQLYSIQSACTHPMQALPPILGHLQSLLKRYMGLRVLERHAQGALSLEYLLHPDVQHLEENMKMIKLDDTSGSHSKPSMLSTSTPILTAAFTPG
jgi:hypothetical protein